MKEPEAKPSTASLSKRTRKILVGVVVALLLVEAVLQIVSFVLVSRRQAVAVAKIPADHVTIVALGESTTDNAFAPERLAWPELLQEKLSARGVKATVVNQGKTGATTSQILGQLGEILETYRPRIVIAMIGVNDTDEWVAEMSRSPLRNVKLWRILSWCYFAAKVRLVPGRSGGLIRKAEDDVLNVVNLEDEAAIDALAPRPRARVFAHLAERIDPLSNSVGSPEREAALRYFRKSFSTGFLVDGMSTPYAIVLADANLKDECLALFERHLEVAGPPRTAPLMMAAEHCAEDTKEWRRVLDANGESLKFFRRSDANFDPRREVFAKVIASGSALIVMNYPLRKVSTGDRSTLSSLGGRSSIVENVENFEAALSTRERREVFTDDFEGDFGHTTKFGHELIAERVLPATIEMIEKVR